MQRGGISTRKRKMPMSCEKQILREAEEIKEERKTRKENENKI